MNSLMFAAANTLEVMDVEFPNLFGGTEMEYRRGFNLFGSNGITIYWYGVLIAVGVVLAYLYMMRRVTRDFGLVKDRVFDVVFVTIICAFICARIYYCVFTNLNPNTPEDQKYTFITTFTGIRDGGIAMYGGTIGAVIFGLLMCKLRKVKFTALADISALGFLIGQTIGRWGNFINQEAYGAECDPNWLFAMSGSRIRAEMPAGVFVHPCFLYESVWCLLGFIFLHIYSKKLRTFDGEIALLYLSWYGFGRFFIEQLRTDSLYLGSLRISQWVGAVSFVGAMVCFVICKIRTAKSKKPLYVNTDASRELIEIDLRAEEERRAKKAKKEKAEDSILAEDIDSVSESEEMFEDDDVDDTNEFDGPDEIDGADESVEVNEIDKADEIDGADEVDETDEADYTGEMETEDKEN